GRGRLSIRFQVQAIDAALRCQDVDVLPPPQLVPLDDRPSPQFHLVPPAYTDLPPVDAPDGASSVEAVAGTRITLRAATDRPLSRAWLEFPVELTPALTVASHLHALATTG